MKQDFQPLRVRAYLQCRVVADKYLPLDGVLFNQFVAGWFGRQDVSLPRSGNVATWEGEYLPIEKIADDAGNWYYACSFAKWHGRALEKKDFFVKQLELQHIANFVDFGNKKGKIDISRGEDKAYMVEFYTRHADYVEWYCRGNKAELELLLPFCTHLGKHSARGYGAVLRWEVSETEKDWYLNNDDGELMRAVPSEKGQQIYGIRPSYWHPKHQTRVVLPA